MRKKGAKQRRTSPPKPQLPGEPRSKAENGPTVALIRGSLDDDRLDRLLQDTSGYPAARDEIDRRVYFKELFRMQGELVKLQDWIQHNK